MNIGRVDSIRLYAIWLNHRDSSATGGAVEPTHPWESRRAAPVFCSAQLAVPPCVL